MMNGDDLIYEAVRVALQNLREEEFLGTVEAGELTWDVYVKPVTGRTEGAAITLAVRVEGEGTRRHAVCVFAPGSLTLAEASRLLHGADA